MLQTRRPNLMRKQMTKMRRLDLLLLSRKMVRKTEEEVDAVEVEEVIVMTVVIVEIADVVIEEEVVEVVKVKSKTQMMIGLRRQVRGSRIVEVDEVEEEVVEVEEEEMIAEAEDHRQQLLSSK